MMQDVIPLSAVDLIVATGLVIAAGVVSILLRLGLERQLLLASIRTVIQLLLIGYILRWVFDIEHWAPLFLVIAVMLAAASRAAVQRSSRVVPGVTGLAFGSLVLSGLITTWTVTGIVIRVEPWFNPQYVIPLLGMVLGNGLTGISLCLDELLEMLSRGRAVVEMELAHGATRWEAARGPVKEGVRRGMIPIINSMMVVGLVSLPGMMTGQILSGTDPLVAVKYQIVVMFMIAAATALGCMLLAWFVYRRVFNDRHQLQSDLIKARK